MGRTGITKRDELLAGAEETARGFGEKFIAPSVIFGRASNDDPAELQLRRERDLGETAENKGHHVGFARPRARRGDAFGRVIEEDLIAHDCEAMLEREAAEHVAIATADERTGRVGRIDAEDGAGLAVEGLGGTE